MALNSRSALDARFAYFARPVAVSMMWGRVEVHHMQAADSGNWNPASGETFGGTIGTGALHYQGRARIQPNQAWRARKYQWEGESAGDFAVLVELDLTGNEVTTDVPLPAPDAPGDTGVLHEGDLVTVTGSYAPYGYPVDAMIMAYQYFVRNVSATSNSWTRVLMCDINPKVVNL